MNRSIRSRISAAAAVVLPVALLGGAVAKDLSTPPGKAAEFQIRSGAIVRLAGGSTLAVERRNTRLQQGTALLSSGKRLVRRGTEKVAAGPLDLSCSGTALVAVTAGGGAKVTCLEGTSTVRLAGRRGHFTLLQPTQMLLVEGGAEALPAPVEIDLDRLARTSNLISRFAPLPTEASIHKQIAKQRRAIAKGELFESDITVTGSGGSTSIENDGPGSDGTQNTSNSGSSGGGGSGGGSSGGSSSGGGAVASVGGASGGLAAAASCA